MRYIIRCCSVSPDPPGWPQTPLHIYRGPQGAALPPLPDPKEKLLSNFPNSLEQTLTPGQSCSRRESLGELPQPRRAPGSGTKGTSAPTAKCQMVHLGSRNHGQSSETEQAARARLLLSCELLQLDLNTVSELWRQLNISIIYQTGFHPPARGVFKMKADTFMEICFNAAPGKTVCRLCPGRSEAPRLTASAEPGSEYLPRINTARKCLPGLGFLFSHLHRHHTII